jgi:hypothetical protein
MSARTDECDDSRVVLRLGGRCLLRSRWIGQPAGHGTDQPGDEWRVGALSVEAGQRCVLEGSSGPGVAMRVQRGTATVDDSLIQISLYGVVSPNPEASGATATATFQFTGALEGKRHPAACPEGMGAE